MGTVGAGGGDPDHLAFTTQPGDAGVAPATLPTVTVKVYDSCGNVATHTSGNVSLALVQPEDTSFGGVEHWVAPWLPSTRRVRAMRLTPRIRPDDRHQRHV